MDAITSTQNPGVKEVVKLRDRRARNRSGLFLIEGYRELLRACDGKVDFDRLYICEELFLGSNEPDLIARFPNVIRCSKEVFAKLSYRDRPDGLLGVAKQRHRTLDDLTGSLFLVAEAIEKPGNLGTMLRSADAVGADGVIVCDRGTDIHNPNVVRASVGTLFTVPVVECASQEAIDWFKERQIPIIAATPAAEVLYSDVDLRGAIAIGTEQLGLSDLWLNQADLTVRLPMKGCADSLNAAMAATVLLYEAIRVQ